MKPKAKPCKRVNVTIHARIAKVGIEVVNSLN